MIGKIKITLPAYTNKPNANGTVFDKKALKKALKKFKDLPIVDRGCTNIIDGIDNYTIPNITTVGIANKAKYKKKQDAIEIEGTLIDTSFSYVYDKDKEKLTIKEVSILGPSLK